MWSIKCPLQIDNCLPKAVMLVKLKVAWKVLVCGPWTSRHTLNDPSDSETEYPAGMSKMRLTPACHQQNNHEWVEGKQILYMY